MEVVLKVDRDCVEVAADVVFTSFMEMVQVNDVFRSEVVLTQATLTRISLVWLSAVAKVAYWGWRENAMKFRDYYKYETLTEFSYVFLFVLMLVNAYVTESLIGKLRVKVI